MNGYTWINIDRLESMESITINGIKWNLSTENHLQTTNGINSLPKPVVSFMPFPWTCWWFKNTLRWDCTYETANGICTRNGIISYCIWSSLCGILDLPNTLVCSATMLKREICHPCNMLMHCTIWARRQAVLPLGLLHFLVYKCLATSCGLSLGEPKKHQSPTHLTCQSQVWKTIEVAFAHR